MAAEIRGHLREATIVAPPPPSSREYEPTTARRPRPSLMSRCIGILAGAPVSGSSEPRTTKSTRRFSSAI
eukprot:3072958-Prymnesium_polylepis.1